MKAGPWSESRGIHGDGPPSPDPHGESGPLLLGCETNTDRTPSSEDRSEPQSTPIVDLALGEELRTIYWSTLKG